jgi:hypothetical protein
MPLEWLAPVEPGHTQLQSIPLALVTVTVAPTDGKHHDVQIYTDITGEGVSGTSRDDLLVDLHVRIRAHLDRRAGRPGGVRRA